MVAPKPNQYRPYPIGRGTASATGSWAECVDSVNTLIGDLVQPTAEVARVIESVARGDLLQTMVLEIDGRPLSRWGCDGVQDSFTWG